MTTFLFYVVMFTSLMVMVVKANMSPSEPEPGSVWTAGREYDITWEEDNSEPTINATWKNFRIDLMTGEDNDQVLLTNIAENVKGDAMKYKYTAPHVDPPAPIYFLMFTSENGEYTWSTRFAIVEVNGKQEVPEKSVQPTGEKIPWGIGKLVTDFEASSVSESDSTAAVGSSSAGASKSAARASPSAVSQVSKSMAPSQAAVQSVAQSSVPVAASSSSAIRKGNVSEMRSMSDAVPQSFVSFTVVGAFVSFVAGLFLF